MTRQKLPILALLVFLMAIMIAPAAAQDGSVPIRMALSNEPSNLDPHINAGTSARTVRLLVYRGLFNYDE